MTPSIRLVIFDLDGTLVDAYPAIVRSFNHVMKALVLPPQPEALIRRSVGWGDTNLLKPFVQPGRLSKALKLYRKNHAAALTKGTRFLPGAKELLRTLKKKGYQLAVASNRPTKFSYIILEHLKMKEYFDDVLCGDRLKKGKPHPEIILRILKRLSIRPEEALFVGDMTVDVQAGNRARVKTVAVLTGSSTRQELKKLKPYKIVKHILEVDKLLMGYRV